MGERVTRWLGFFALPTTRRTAVEVAATIAAVALGLLVATFVSRTFQVGPLTVTAQLSFGWPGQSTLRVPPFGEAHARTHMGPARIVATIEEVDLPAVERLLLQRPEAPAPSDTPTIRSQTQAASGAVSQVLEQGTRSVDQYLIELGLLATLVAVIVAAVAAWAFRRSRRSIVRASAIALAVMLLSGALAGATYRPSAFASPRLQGALAYVPRLQSVLAGRLSRIEALREQAASVAENLAAYYADPRSIAVGGGLPGTYRVLDVSDLHLDPIGAELARSFARSYEASLVIDTGDLVILGGQQETALLSSLVVTSTPVLFVPGNHDSLQTTRALSQLPNVSVATTGSVTIDGLNIYTLPDPVGASASIEPDPRLIAEVTSDTVSVLGARASAGLPQPDIIVTHNPAAQREYEGLAPLVLAGHTHEGRLIRGRETVFLNPGTLGGMPYDPVVSGRPRLPHGAAILYYTPDIPRKLIAIDRLSVGVDGTTELDRTVVDESLLP